MAAESLEQKYRVLIVDDDADIRSIVASSLLALNVIVHEAEDGGQALDWIEREGMPDILLSDVMMPVLSGIELCKRFRELPGAENVPVMMLTAKDSVRDIVFGLDEGADDYLTKPFHYEELQARVRALLRVRELNLRLQGKNDELVVMQQELIEKNRQALVGELAGAAAHELGQPLSAILLNIHLIEQLAELAPQAFSALGAIKGDAKRMVNIVNDLQKADASTIKKYGEGISILSFRQEKEDSSL